MSKLYLMNTPVLTSYGVFEYQSISLSTAKSLLYSRDFISAIGHDSTAQVLTELLGMKIEKNRIQVHMEEGDQAIIFKLKQRPPEGKILTKEEIEQIGYEFALLEKTEDLQ